MITKRIEEFQISTATHQQIQILFASCFPEYPKDRTYFKQVPTFRYLVWESEQLIGHLGVDHRIIRVGNQLVSIMGIVDLCIDPAFQSKKIASNLIQKLNELAQQHQIDFLVLVTADHNYYRKHGFQLVQNICRWLIINNHQMLGIGHRRIEESLMVKAIGDKKWNDGMIDFLGHIF